MNTIKAISDGKDKLQTLWKRIYELEAERQEISALFPDDATHKHEQTGESLYDNIQDALRDLARAKLDFAAARSLLAEHGFGIHSDTLDDALRQVLQAYISEAGNAKTAVERLAAAREDVARLTWISANLNRDAHGKDVPFIVSTVMQDVLLHCPPMGSKYPHIRAAIDSARAGGGK